MLLCCLLLALARADEPRIPRMIWQTGRRDVSGLTHLRADATEELAAANPGWTRSLLNDSEADEFMRAHTPPYVYETYGALRPALGAARADLLRYALIAHHGGAYLDLDVACRPLDSFVRADDGCLLSPSAYRATVGGGALVESSRSGQSSASAATRPCDSRSASRSRGCARGFPARCCAPLARRTRRCCGRRARSLGARRGTSTSSTVEAGCA